MEKSLIVIVSKNQNIDNRLTIEIFRVLDEFDCFTAGKKHQSGCYRSGYLNCLDEGYCVFGDFFKPDEGV
jgi:hypothetical protein